MLLNQMRGTEQVGGSVKSLVCPALASHKLFGEFEKVEQSLGPGKQGLFLLSGDYPTNSSHKNR